MSASVFRFPVMRPASYISSVVSFSSGGIWISCPIKKSDGTVCYLFDRMCLFSLLTGKGNDGFYNSHTGLTHGSHPIRWAPLGCKRDKVSADRQQHSGKLITKTAVVWCKRLYWKASISGLFAILDVHFERSWARHVPGAIETRCQGEIF